MKRVEVNPGDRYGRMEIIRESEPSGEKRRFLCSCKCGNERIIFLGHLCSGNTKSCGCLKIERVTTHGLRQHPLYEVWNNIKSRCENTKHNRYHRYGGRGITVCQEWNDTPTAFINWAETHGWEPGLQIDRIDNDGNYSPDNCRFVTHTENVRNSSNAKLNEIAVEGIRSLLSAGWKQQDIADLYFVDESTISDIKTGRTWKKSIRIR